MVMTNMVTGHLAVKRHLAADFSSGSRLHWILGRPSPRAGSQVQRSSPIRSSVQQSGVCSAQCGGSEGEIHRHTTRSSYKTTTAAMSDDMEEGTHTHPEAECFIGFSSLIHI